MSKSDEEKAKKKVKAQDIDSATFEVSYTNEQPIQNAEIVQMSELKINPNKMNIKLRCGKEGDENYREATIENADFDYTYKKGFEFIDLFSLSSLRRRNSNGETAANLNNNMKNFIRDNYETNPELVQLAIMQLLGDSEKQHYDRGTGNIFGISGYTRENQGDNSLEVLQKILKTPDNTIITGFVCSTMAEWGKFIFDELNIPATLIAGGTKTSNHTTLLWQRADGKYVHTNYNESYVLNATNMMDAIKEIYKRGLGLRPDGYAYIIDENGSYNENIMGEVAAIGEKELDKSDYNNQSLFDNKVAKNSSVDGKANVSSLGSVSAEVSITTAGSNFDDTINKERTLKFGYKTTKNSSIADESESVGGEWLSKKEKILQNGKTFKSTKVIANITTLKSKAPDMSYNYIQPAENVSLIDPAEIEKLRQYRGAEYEEAYSLEGYNNDYEHYLRKLDYLLNDYQKNFSQLESPISKEEYIKDYMQKRMDKEPNNSTVFYDTWLSWAEKSWEDYIIDNYYIGSEEILNQRIAYNKDHIDNYEKYKQEFIDAYVEEDIVRDSGIKNNDENELKDFKTTHLTAFIRQVFGKEKTVLKNDKLELSDGYQISGLLGFNKVFGCKSFGGDARICAEAGTKLNVYGKNSLFSTNLSAGVTGDLSLKTGCLTPTVSPGLKLNAGVSYKTKINDNIVFGASAKGYSVMTGLTTGSGSHDWGGEAELQASIKPKGLDMTLFSCINAGKGFRRVESGGFKELIKHMTNFGFSIGTIFKSGNSIVFNLQKQKNYLNSTYNNETYSICANVRI